MHLTLRDPRESEDLVRNKTSIEQEVVVVLSQDAVDDALNQGREIVSLLGLLGMWRRTSPPGGASGVGVVLLKVTSVFFLAGIGELDHDVGAIRWH